MSRRFNTNLIAGALLAGTSIVMAGTSTLGDLHEEDVEGKSVFDSTGTLLGDADELVETKSHEKMVVIDLEDDDKEVAVPLDRFSMSSDGKNLTTQMTRAQLLALPDYDPMDMEDADN
jgi:hypothetical protein